MKTPSDLRILRKNVVTWLDGLQGKTVAEVRDQLGVPLRESLWESNGFSGPMLHYNFDDRTTLIVQFLLGKAGGAILQITRLYPDADNSKKPKRKGRR